MGHRGRDLTPWCRWKRRHRHHGPLVSAIPVQPSGQTLGGGGTVELEGNHHVVDVNHIASGGQHPDKLCASSGKAGHVFFHDPHLA